MAQQVERMMEGDSDTEEDPTSLLNLWLGELDNLKQGLDTGVYNGEENKKPPAVHEIVRTKSPVTRRPASGGHVRNNQYRRSLINIDSSRDEELDAILGELTVLESQFESEIKIEDAKPAQQSSRPASQTVVGGDPFLSNRKSPVNNAVHSCALTAPDLNCNQSQVSSNNDNLNRDRNGRTESPDTDSAFCDNLSVVSSCSSSQTDQSQTCNNRLSNSSQAQLDAKLKAEKIKIAIEKIKEASVKKIFIKVFTSDGSAKSLLVDEKMSVGYVTRVLAEKNHVQLDPKWALVELVPDLYMERVYEDHEMLVENCMLWKVDSKNTLWFIERPEKFDLFVRPEVYLLGSSSSQKDDQMEEHSRQELLEEYFSSSGVGAPELEGQMWLKMDNKKSWKRYHFVLRTSGLYYAPKGKKSSKDLVCLTTFDVNQVYYGIGWKNKYKAPTEHAFGIKHPQIQAKNPKYIKYLCVDTQKELHQWVTGIRIAKNGRSMFDNYRSIVEEITHADIDILTAKRFSVNSTPGNPAEKSPSDVMDEIHSPARTPSSENKSLTSALSSGIESDLSPTSYPGQQHTTASQAAASDTGRDNSRVTTCYQDSLPRSAGRPAAARQLAKGSPASSNGCLSERSSSGVELCFESDSPAGGTIKKRPAVTPRLPLTSTTWGMVREEPSDCGEQQQQQQQSNTDSLLRSTVRRSVSAKTCNNGFRSERQQQQQQQPPPPQHTDTGQYGYEQSLSDDDCLPLPPPPRVDSIPNLDEIDALPPPPDTCHDVVAAPPPAASHAPRKQDLRISFDDRVQVLGPAHDAPPPVYARPARLPPPAPLVLKDKESGLPTEFFADLQRVMNKKWQVAEKCRVNHDTTPHHVLGFRDEWAPKSPEGFYSRDSDIGAWVLESQQYNHTQFVNDRQPVVLTEPELTDTPRSKQPPPPPPRRSENTHLSKKDSH